MYVAYILREKSHLVGINFFGTPCIAEITSFNRCKFRKTVFCFNKVMREEVELFE